ncbi:hypothetical protein BRC86_04480 [Halobacteriales archaeon QS_3_64_16]|nr:MAG: hypothetical protein BRC86_04480 [Halobacteriales archaeon QS_3_64_16]
MYLTSTLNNTRNKIDGLAPMLSADQATNTRSIEGSSVYVLIPGYNEENAINSVIESLSASIYGHEVVPGHDGWRLPTLHRRAR